MIAQQGQRKGSDWLSAVFGQGFAWASDAIRWTATEDSLWSFPTLKTKLVQAEGLRRANNHEGKVKGKR